MKNSKEMADAVFRIRDACLEQKRRRIRIVRRISAVGGAACLCGLLITAGIHFAPVREPLPGIPPETAATGTQTARQRRSRPAAEGSTDETTDRVGPARLGLLL